MDEKDQVTICREIAKACMWGQGGIARVIIDGFDRSVAAPRNFSDLRFRP